MSNFSQVPDCFSSHRSPPDGTEDEKANSTNDLKVYKLSKDDLDHKLKSRKHKPLQDYTNLNLTRRKRPDGSEYVIGKHISAVVDPTKSMLKSRPRSAEERSPTCDFNLLNERSSSSQEKLPEQESESHAALCCDRTDPKYSMYRIPSSFHFTHANGTVETSGVSGSNDEEQAIEITCDATDLEASSDFEEVETFSPQKNQKNVEKEVKAEAYGMPCTSSSPMECSNENTATKRRAWTLSESANKMKGGALRVDAHSPLSGQRVNQRLQFPTQANKKEKVNENDLEHLKSACEELRTKVVKFEFMSGRMEIAEPLERRSEVQGSYTEFLLKTSSRIVDYLSKGLFSPSRDNLTGCQWTRINASLRKGRKLKTSKRNAEP
eukprot:83939-Hanusia_phi.AAC.4